MASHLLHDETASTQVERTPQPGPWTASEMTMDAALWAGLNEGRDLTIVQANWDGFTGDVIAAVWCDDNHDELATARLIAAAPDLYAAAKLAAPHGTRLQYGSNVSIPAAVYHALCAAIEKAEAT